MDESTSERGAVRRSTASGASENTLASAIEAMQAAAYRDAPWMIAELDAKSVQSALQRVEGRYAGYGLGPPPSYRELTDPVDDFPMPKRSPSRLQDPLVYGLMRDIWRRVDDLARRRGHALARMPLLASLPTGLVNARAVRHAATGETGIIFDDELKQLAYFLSKVIASVVALPGSAGDQWANVDLNRAGDPHGCAPEAVDRFIAMLEQYLRYGCIRTLPSWVVPTPAQHHLALVLCDSFECFVMAHEYGHLALHHLEGACHFDVDEHPELTEVRKGRVQEVEADTFGLAIACENASARQFGSPVVGFWGAYLACKSFELLDRGVYALAKGCDWAPFRSEVLGWADERFDHPPSTIRGALLRQAFGFAWPAVVHQADEFIAATDILFDKLFAAALPPLLAGREFGVQWRFEAQYALFAEAPGPSPNEAKNARGLVSLADIIETMQAAGLSGAASSPGPLDAARVDAAFARAKTSYAAHHAHLNSALGAPSDPPDSSVVPAQSPLRLQDPLVYEWLRGAWARVDKLACWRRHSLPDTPLLATAPTGLVNARTFRLRQTGEIAIVFDDDLRLWGYGLSEIVASVVASPGSDSRCGRDLDLARAQEPGRWSPDAVQRFAKLLDRYLREGWLRSSPPRSIPPEQQRLALILDAAFECFVIGHEYGHLARGHLKDTYVGRVPAYPELREVLKDRAHEFEADAFGLTMACDHTHETFGSAVLGFWGAYLACKSCELIDRSIYAAAKGCDWAPFRRETMAWADHTLEHPPLPVRGLFLRELFAMKTFIDQIDEVIEATDILFDALFAEALPALLAGRDRDVHPRFREQFGVFAHAAPGPEPPVA